MDDALKLKEARCKEAALVLANAFNWYASPEGGDYWSGLYDKLRERGGEVKLPTDKLDNIMLGRVPEPCRLVASVIMGAFAWADTPEGRDYWAKAYDLLMYRAHSMAPPPEPKRRWGLRPIAWKFGKAADRIIGDSVALMNVPMLAQPNVPMPAYKPKPKPFKMTPEKMRDFFEKRGWRRIGSGAYSVVLGHDKSDLVIKINRRRDAWPEYVCWAKESGFAGTFAPNVHALKFYGEGEWYVAIMDRLDGTVSHLMGSNPLASALSDLRYTIRPYLTGDVVSEDCSLDSDELDERIAYVKHQYVCEKFPGLLDFCEDFSRKFDKVGHLDDHLGNWMLKGSQVVLTDPLADEASSYSDPSSLRIKSDLRRGLKAFDGRIAA